MAGTEGGKGDDHTRGSLTHAWGKAPFHNDIPKQTPGHSSDWPSSAGDQSHEAPNTDHESSGGWGEGNWTTQTSGKKAKGYDMPAAWTLDAAPANSCMCMMAFGELDDEHFACKQYALWLPCAAAYTDDDYLACASNMQLVAIRRCIYLHCSMSTVT